MSGIKGATLAKVTAAGLPVPGGFIVCTEVFADSLQDVMFEIDDSLKGLPASAVYSDMSSLRKVLCSSV